MKYILTKGNQRTIISQSCSGKCEITSDMYLTAYESYGCKSVRVVSNEEAQEILNRLQRKGFTCTRR